MLGWLLRNAGLTALLAAAAYVAVLVLGEAGLFGDEPIASGDYAYVLIFCAFGWPLYMAALGVAARRARRFRRWAVALSPIVGLPLTIGILFINVPEILAGWLMWLSLGALVAPPPARR